MSETEARPSLEHVESRLDTLMAILKIAALVLGLLTIGGGVAVRQLDLMTKTEHQTDVRELSRMLTRQDQVLRCLLWQVPPEQCETYANRPLPRPGPGR